MIGQVNHKQGQPTPLTVFPTNVSWNTGLFILAQSQRTSPTKAANFGPREILQETLMDIIVAFQRVCGH